MLMLYWQLAGWLSLIILSLFACFFDWRDRTIPNVICLSVFFISIIISPVAVTLLWGIKISALIALVLILYHYQIWGGGDAKLLLAFLPAIEEKFLLLTVVLIGLAGGVLGVIYLIYGVCTDMQKVRDKGLPFGIPISFVCLLFVTASLKG